MSRILLRPAGPIEFDGIRYKNMGDRSPEQEFKIASWQVDLSEKLVELNKEYPNFKIYTFGRAYAYRYFYKQLIKDVMWAGLSSILVHMIICYHTGSIFVGSTSCFMILISFPVTLVIYKKIFMITNVSSLHLMVVFVVLGIAADNIFVLWDAWKQSSTFY